ncbi:hypothetical protein [Pedobacter agri]|uniref:hypothetical protein n=1 Tax=Pedobacter agri TaxID=454586 RepID=UPI00277FF02C|nr:hypothetical protein [Pedobacter agri]MDQ1142969.1 hypothetical protein [Pedobacter agri]
MNSNVVMDGLDFRGNSFGVEGAESIDGVLKRYFKGIYERGLDGKLDFVFSDGISESFDSGKHQMAMSSGIWYCSPGLFTCSSLYVCASAMEAVAYAMLQNSKFTDLDQSCWIAFGLNCSLPVIVPKFCFARKIYLLFGRDLLDVLRAVKICVSVKGFSVNFRLLGDQLCCQFRGRSYIFPVEGFSLSRFKQATGFRDYSSMKRPSGADSFLDQLRFGS